jgi:hypothetical protein
LDVHQAWQEFVNKVKDQVKWRKMPQLLLLSSSFSLLGLAIY